MTAKKEYAIIDLQKKTRAEARKEGIKMKYIVKYRKIKHYPFVNYCETRKATRGKFKGGLILRDVLFDTREQAEEVRKAYAEKFGEENAKIVERKA